MSYGQQLLDIADGAYNSRTNEYHGVNFNLAVSKAMRLDAKENGKQGRKRKVRREEATRTVTALFDRSRQQSAERLGVIADEAASLHSVDEIMALAANDKSELYAFALEVLDELNHTDLAFGTNIYAVLDPQMIITLITTIIQVIQMCKNLNPTS